ncbi:MAG: methyltransferase domain-containing protein, partial [Rhizomicrobium sp.]
IEPYMDAATFDTARKLLLDRLDDICAKFELTNDARRTLSNMQPDDFSYLAPFDSAAIPDGSLDLIVSRAVLEHIPPDDLQFLMIRLRSKLKRDGLMAHAIDNSDHYEHRDKSISRVNFLTWSPRKHRIVEWLAGNEGENRLRHHEYQSLFEQSGYETVLAASDICQRTRDALPQLRLASPYRFMTQDQLAALGSYYVARPV